MAATVLVNDFFNNERYYIALGPKEEKKLAENWHKPDSLLDGLCHTQVFKDRRVWSELLPSHYQILLLRNFLHIDDLTVEQKQDVLNETMQSLYFLTACFIRSLPERAETEVEFLKLIRHSKERLTIDYHASVTLELDLVTANESSLKVVVDNTKEVV